MSLRVRSVAVLGALLLSVAATRNARAADQQIVGQISSLTKSALAAYGDGDLDKAKSQLLQAVALSKKDGDVAEHPVMARTFLLLGVLYIDGYDNRKTGLGYLGKALAISPDIEVPETLATKSVMKAFDEARGGAAAPAAAEASASDADDQPKEKPKSARELREDKARAAREAKEERENAARQAKEDKEAAARQTKDEAKEERDTAARQAREEKEAAAREAKSEQQVAKAVAAEKKRAEADARERDRQAREEKAQADKELAAVRANEAKERADKERLAKEKEERDGQIRDAKTVLTDAKQKLQQLEKENADKDKQLAAGAERERKEREAKEKLAQEKAQLTQEKAQLAQKDAQEKAAQDRVVADLKQQIQQLQKDKQDRDKTIASGLDREKKEREAKEKLDRERQVAEAREKERKNQEESARAEREKLAEGPELPSHVGEPIYCALPDEAQAGTDLFVHCTPQQNGKAKELAIYYRPNGVAHYNSLTLTRSKKGWYTTVIPANHVSGKLLQYYVEARDARDGVTATNGKANSPNVLTLKPAGALLAGGSRSSGSSFTEASSVSGKRQARSAGTARTKSR